MKTALKVKTRKPGTVTSIQTFGDYRRWHSHLHLLAANGLFLADSSFYVMLEVYFKPL